MGFWDDIITGASFWFKPGNAEKTAKKLYDIIENPQDYPSSIGQGLENIVRISNALNTGADPNQQINPETLNLIHTAGDVVQKAYEILPASSAITAGIQAGSQLAAGAGYDRLGNLVIETGIALLPEGVGSAISLARNEYDSQNPITHPPSKFYGEPVQQVAPLVSAPKIEAEVMSAPTTRFSKMQELVAPASPQFYDSGTLDIHAIPPNINAPRKKQKRRGAKKH